jgi:hypothetical protein
MALDLMVEHLPEVPQVHHLPTSGTRIEMISLVFRFAALPVADDLTGLNQSECLRTFDAVSTTATMRSASSQLQSRRPGTPDHSL